MNKESVDLIADIVVIGEYKDPEKIENKLKELDEIELNNQAQSKSKNVDDILKKDIFELLNSPQKRPWSYTTHQFGYIAPLETVSSEPQPILYPGTIAPDDTLKNSRINVRLDRLRVYEYPGRGTHNVMVTFATKNQVGDSEEVVSFNQTYRIPERNSAGIIGYPIFTGLNVGSQGVTLECSTINVKNKEDDAILEALESNTFKIGLKLLTTTQPAIAPFTTISLGLVKSLAQKHRNVGVQKLSLGLDFENAAMGIRLAEGNYIAVQVPEENTINWDNWVYQPNLGSIVHKENGGSLEYNYFVFRISRYED
ncbi:MAG: hypothetical protein DSM107014_13550 [Gomphosphaeria aponina SAG 52.96 = DSM 107014]|uniref:Uncharacterized protein n=1 Tax=Gomphosphaeria aponina SAG 52.96 = DSM 107014 TaxID=1521640 RepID=A0A941GWH7_9CHRO|nr:hypothetical protein [Gomphosphaeria aponina SAG 52.96 = DSM 107014]